MFKRIIILISIISVLIIGSIVYFLVFKKPAEKPQIPEEKTLEEKLKDITAPSIGESPEVSEEVIENLTAPGRGEVLEDILQKLTAPK